MSPSVPLLPSPPATPLSITSVDGVVTLSGVCEPVDTLEPSYWEVFAFEVPVLRDEDLDDLFPPEERPPEELLEAPFETLLREALEPPRLADDPLEAPFLALLFPPLEAAFFGAAFFVPFFAVAFLGAAFLAAFFTPPFLAAAFFGALFLEVAFFIPFLAALFLPPSEELFEAPLLELPRLELLEDFEPPRLEELLLALLDEDLPPPELLEADFSVAAFFFDFAIFNGF